MAKQNWTVEKVVAVSPAQGLHEEQGVLSVRALLPPTPAPSLSCLCPQTGTEEVIVPI
jgi:hypothetical protein